MNLVDVIRPVYDTFVQPDCATDRAEQLLLVHGLPQMPGRPGPFDALAGRRIVLGRDEEDGDAYPVSRQAFLKIEPAHSVQMDVEEEAGRSTTAQRVEELVGRCEGLDGVATRLDQAMERPTDRGVVVHDGNDWCIDHREAPLKLTLGGDIRVVLDLDGAADQPCSTTVRR